jgi:hypothetical protein
MEKGDREQEAAQYQLHLLAAACLEMAVTLSQETKDQAQQRLARLVPPTNFAEAVDIASAGDLATPYLTANRQYSEWVASACVRALAHIHTEDALVALEGYAPDTREPVREELVRAWDSFDRKEYAHRVLAKFPEKRLRLKNATTLDGCEYLTNLTWLDLYNCYQVTDLTSLAGLTKLTRLDLHFCRQVSDLTPLAGLTNLTELDLSDTLVSALTPLSGLTYLTKLDLSSSQVSDLTPLAGLTNLFDLILLGCSDQVRRQWRDMERHSWQMVKTRRAYQNPAGSADGVTE